MSTDAQNLLARLDRIPVWPYPYWVLFTLGAGFFFAFYDVVTIGIALPVVIKQFHATLATALWTITSMLIGYIVGSIIDSRISDHFGRKISLVISILFFSTGSLLSAFSTDIYFLIAMRFFVGVGIGSEIANITAYMGELAPASNRGKYSCVVMGMGYFGIALVPFIGLAVVPNFEWGWRVLFAIGSLGALSLVFLRWFIPESIRWHINKNQMDQAEILLTKLEHRATERYGKPLPEPKKIITSSLKPNVHWAHLFRAPYLKQSFIYTIVWLFYYIGAFSWLSLNTKLFIFEGYNLTHSILLVALSSIGYILGPLLSIYLADRFERKYSIFALSVIWTISLLIIGWFPNYATIMIFGCIIAITISSQVPLMYVLTGESFPTGCRATGIAMTDGIGHIGGAFCGQIMFGIYYALKFTGYGYGWTFSAMALTGALTAIAILFAQRQTGKPIIQ